MQLNALSMQLLLRSAAMNFSKRFTISTYSFQNSNTSDFEIPRLMNSSEGAVRRVCISSFSSENLSIIAVLFCQHTSGRLSNKLQMSSFMLFTFSITWLK